MRIFVPAAAAMLLAACSETPAPETKPKASEAPPQAITGRQAFQHTYASSRAWAIDALPLHIRSFNLPNPKSADGKAGAWEIVFVSASRSRSRIFTWSAIEGDGNFHKGVFGGQEESWSEGGSQRPFPVAAIKIDTPEALKTALTKVADQLKKNPNPPQLNFLLESTSRFPNPAWRVYWGDSVSTAFWSVFIDASTGEYLGR
jgi:hypothetical protein